MTVQPRSISPKSISPIVDDNYRIQPADHAGQTRRVVIANVTYQGVEEMTPVLHIEGQSKRLVLSPDQVEQIIDITGTTLFPQWIGVPILLQPRIEKSDAKAKSRILIKAATQKSRGQPMPAYISEDRRGWYLALIVVGLLLTISMIFVVLNLPTILVALQQLRDNWPLR